MRTTVTYSFQDDSAVLGKSLLLWAEPYEEVVWLDSNGHDDTHGSFESILAVDALTSKITDTYNAFHDLEEYQSETKDWIFGYLSYDLKNDLEVLSSKNFDGLQFPELYFFQPKKIIVVKNNALEFHYLKMVDDEIETDFQQIQQLMRAPGSEHRVDREMRIRMRIFKDEYFNRVDQLLHHIHRGDIYEANFCQEFYAENTEIDPIRTYHKLNNISKAPFATFLKLGAHYLLSASPERYLKKKGNTILSQPIKGTAKRSLSMLEDMALKKNLQQDEKERAENIMIVDLVRNDLSKSAVKGTVKVEALCEVKTYEQVHQMVSTISAQSDCESPVTLLRDTFPMGSMTGAPKVSAMQLIEKLESFKRGLYSGTVGYFSPEGDFDFNVVIRSILYNAQRNYVSFSVGSAITAKASPAKEYEECLLKAKAMREVLES